MGVLKLVLPYIGFIKAIEHVPEFVNSALAVICEVATDREMRIGTRNVDI